MSDFRIFDEEVTDRFLRYVRIHTASDSSLAGQKRPTTECQRDLLNLLYKELQESGYKDLLLLEEGYLICRIPPSSEQYAGYPSLAFMAHVDTSDDESGENVQPKLHEKYDGDVLNISSDIRLSPQDEPDLLQYVGETIITASGDTLLGADDKSGVAVLMTVLSFLSENKNFGHGPLEVIFTTDEETGTGMDAFPLKELQSEICYTIDGGREPEIEAECYNAAAAQILFTGNVVHPGYGRGRLVNAVSMAGCFINMLPRNESPEATDGRYGNFWPHDVTARMGEASLTVMIRDFDAAGLDRRKKMLYSIAETVQSIFHGGTVEVSIQDQYKNMWSKISKRPEIMERLSSAVRETGIEPEMSPIRGGTDGSRLTEMGIPTPNIFTGGHNFHSRREWIAVPALSRVCQIVLNLVKA